MEEHAYVRAALQEDIAHLAENLREEDVAEVRAFSGHTPLEALTNGFEHSKPCFTVCATEGDEPVAIFGTVPSEEREMAVVWMLGTPKLFDVKFTFLRQCKEWVRFLNRSYPVLYNYVDARNKVHIRWLKWMGFTFINRHPQFGNEKRMFYEFVRIH